MYASDGDIGELSTCATVRIDFPGDKWSEVGNGLGKLAWHDFPKKRPDVH